MSDTNTDTDTDANPKADYQAERPRLRKVTTIDLFEMYWVIGMATDEIIQQTPYKGASSVSETLRARGIPVREQTDRQQYRRGDIDIDTLRRKYLNNFQKAICSELQVMREDRLLDDLENSDDI
jgi:hypothetical protein